MSSRKSSQVALVRRIIPVPVPTNTTTSTTVITSDNSDSSTTTPSGTSSPIISTSPTPSAFPSDSTAVSTAASTPAQTSATTSAQSSIPSPANAVVSSTSNAGTIAGSVVGGIIFLVLVVLAILLYLRARKRKRTPPSSEFMNSLRAGAVPVLRLDLRTEYTPTLPEKGDGHTHYPPTVPLPFLQNSYYTSPPMQNMQFPDEMMGRPSVEKPLHPQRFSSPANDMFVTQHNPSTSVGSRRELWGSDMEIISGESSPVHHSPPRVDSVLHFAPRFSLDEPSSQPLYPSHSPTSLQPLRRQPE